MLARAPFFLQGPAHTRSTHARVLAVGNLRFGSLSPKRFGRVHCIADACPGIWRSKAEDKKENVTKRFFGFIFCGFFASSVTLFLQAFPALRTAHSRCGLQGICQCLISGSGASFGMPIGAVGVEWAPPSAALIRRKAHDVRNLRRLERGSPFSLKPAPLLSRKKRAGEGSPAHVGRCTTP